MLVRLTRGKHYQASNDGAIERVAVGTVFEVSEDQYRALRDRVQKIEQAPQPSTVAGPAEPAPVPRGTPTAQVKPSVQVRKEIELLSIGGVLQQVRVGNLDVREALEAEKMGRNRRGLVDGLQRVINRESA